MCFIQLRVSLTNETSGGSSCWHWLKDLTMSAPVSLQLSLLALIIRKGLLHPSIHFLGKKHRQSKDNTTSHVSYQKKKARLLPTHMHRLPLMSQWPELVTWTPLAARKSG